MGKKMFQCEKVGECECKEKRDCRLALPHVHPWDHDDKDSDAEINCHYRIGEWEKMRCVEVGGE